jgi:mRNA interferase RelE/StbE
MTLRIRKAINEYATDPAAHANNVRVMAQSEFSRLRIGNYRVVFQESETEITVVKIGPRGSVYD